MKKTFKIMLLSASIAAALPSAIAGTLSVTEQTHSTEGLDGVTADQTSNSISYALGATYAVGDTISFQFNADVISKTTFSSQITVDPVDSATSADAIAGVVLGFLNTDETTANFRITAINQPDDTPGDGGTEYTDRSTVGAAVAFGTVTYSISSLDSTFSMTVFSNTSNGGSLDNNATATLAGKSSQFGSATISTSFDNVIDVATVRKTFTSGTTDTMSWSVTNPTTTDWLNLATINSSKGTVMTFKGESGKMSDLSSDYFTVAGGGTITYTAESDKVDVSYSDTVTSDTLTFTPPTGDSAIALQTQSFTTDIVYNYASAGAAAGVKTITSGLASGAWTLNGASVVIPYMPFSDNASQIVYLTNMGTQTGDITVTAFESNGTKYDLGVVASSVGGQITKLGTTIKQALATQGFSSGKLAITIT
ncbi:MAG: hypothetical protein MJK04_30085, partial [Psychrosphaera sp.]|nr:hypothetical protein [Psychrosphaera sp.]